MKTATRYLVRPMTLADIEQVSTIDRDAFPATWPPTSFQRELRDNRLARYLVAVERVEGEATLQASEEGGRRSAWEHLAAQLRHLLAPPAGERLRGERICGYVGIWLMADEAHIVSIAVSPSNRHRGIGELLLLATIDLALAARLRVVSLECRVSNYVAQSLYEKYQFQRVGLRPRYYSDNHEDALIMTSDPIASPEYQAFLAQRKRQHQERWGEPRIDQR